MIPHGRKLPRQNSEAEFRAFEDLCRQLAGFDPDFGFEWADGFLTAVAAGPLVPAPETWIPALCGEAFERAFADPEAEAQARRTLGLRLKVLCDQLDPQALADDAGALRLNPMVAEWTDEDRERLRRDDGVADEDLALLHTGSEWAAGFLDGMQALPDLWTEPADEAAASVFGELVDQVAALALPHGGPAWREHVAAFHPRGEPSRDALLAQACWAVQDLRLYWLDHAPRPATRRVAPTPGRTEACPCGSGRKYKKCCGAAAS